MDLLKVIGEPNRRQILRLVARQEVAAGEIADQLPVTFGAVSQHLAVLRSAGLVTVRQDGRRRLYRADADALREFEPLLETMWRLDLDRLAAAAERETGTAREAAVTDERIVLERWIDAPPAVVFSFLTDPARWTQWQGTEADLDPRPGGVFAVNVRGDGFTSGTFVTVEPERHVAFTWGFDRPGHPLPAGSTLVEIDLEEERGGTRLRLTHRRLPPGFQAVRRGWDHYLDRLRLIAAGRDPGPDPNRVTPAP